MSSLAYELDIRLSNFEGKLNSALNRFDKNAQGQAKKTGTSFGKLFAANILADIGSVAFMRSIDAVFSSIQDSILTQLDVEDQMADVAKTTGLAGDALEKMEEDLFAIGRTSRTTNEDLRAIAENVGRLGIEGADNILAFTESVNILSVALGDEFIGGAEQVTAEVGKLSNVLKGIPAENRADKLLFLGNALNILGANTAATAPTIADFAGRIGGLAPRLGAANILGISAALEELGVTAERGGSAVGRTVQQIGQLLADPGDAQLLAKYMGSTVDEITRLFNENPNEVFLQLSKAIGDGSLNSVELAKALDELGLSGVGTSEVIQKVGGNLGLVEKNQKLANDALDNSNSILDEYNIKNETGAASLQKFFNRIEELQNALGEALAPAFNAVLDALTPFVDGFIEFAEENPEVIKNTILLAGAVAGIAGAVASAVFAWPALTALFGGLTTVVTTLTGAFGGFFAFFTGGGLAALGTTIGGFFATTLPAFFAGLPALIGGAMAGIPALIAGLPALLAGVIPAIISALAPILLVIGAIVGVILTVIAVFQHWQEILEMFQPVIVLLQETFNQLVPVFNNIVAYLQEVFEPIIQRIIDEVFPAIIPVIERVIQTFQAMIPFIEPVARFLIDVISNAVNMVIDVFKGLMKFFEGAFDVIEGIFTGDGQKIADGFVKIFQGLEGIVGGLFKGVLNTIIETINAGFRLVNNLGDQLQNASGGSINVMDIPTIPKLAKGARNFFGGMAIVGEQGPELVNIPRGADVFTNSESEDIINGQRQPASIYIDARGALLSDKTTADWFRKVKKIAGEQGFQVA